MPTLSPGNVRVTIVLPFRLPTWNAILAMDLRQRMRVKKWIREYVSDSIRAAGGRLIPMDSILRPQLTDSEKAAYLSMIRPATSKRLATRRKRARSRKR